MFWIVRIVSASTNFMGGMLSSLAAISHEIFVSIEICASFVSVSLNSMFPKCRIAATRL